MSLIRQHIQLAWSEAPTTGKYVLTTKNGSLVNRGMVFKSSISHFPDFLLVLANFGIVRGTIYCILIDVPV